MSSEQTFPKIRKCNGVMGVPITFFDKYDPAEWEIVGKSDSLYLNGQKKYARILIRRRAKAPEADANKGGLAL